jgi:hypothetical protein
MNTLIKNTSLMVLLGVALITGCATKKPPAQPTQLDQTLQQAEKDARSGNEQKAIEEINEAEKELIQDEKKKPVPQSFRSSQGNDLKAKAEEDAIKELEHAKKDAGKKLAGDAADEIRNAAKDVKVEESK